MSEKVSTIDVRQRIGDMLNRVALRRDEFVIERKGGGGLTERATTNLSLEAQAWARKQSRKPRRRTK